MVLREIPSKIGKDFIAAHHYAVISPPITKLALGAYERDTLIGVALWGYGTRPKHTIKRLFPSLDTADYLELNRFCVLDSEPRNTESAFMALMVRYIRQHQPSIKVLFSWADGLRGKPGYVYQACNWLYGGFIKSQFYVSESGEVIHPRFIITRYGSRSKEKTVALGLRKVHGYQFRYCLFLCGHAERKRLLHESEFEWGALPYPKHADLRYWIDAGEGSRESRELPKLQGPVRFRDPALTLF